MQISDEAREECEQVSLHRNACLRKARWFCTNYCSQFPDTDKCDTHCEGEAKPCREVCRPNGHCHTECAELPSQPEDEPAAAGDLRLLYRPNIPLLVRRDVYGRGWKYNALPIHEFQYGRITGTSIDSIWAQGDSYEVVRRPAN